MPQWFDSFLISELAHRDDLGLLRVRRDVRPLDAVHVEIDGQRYVNFCSNNYLGLTHHPRVIAAQCEAAREFGAGAGSAGLISGYTTVHAAAEAEIATWKQTESSILLPSGYQANQAVIQTLAALGEKYSGGVRFLVDKLAHASLLDAIRGSAASARVFPHNGLAKLKRLLNDGDKNQLQVVVTESIFSMDGDAVDLAALVEMKAHHDFLLLLDEAHGSGVYGPNGAGWAVECGLGDAVDISIVTLSKAVGCTGGAICGSKVFCDAVVNLGRAYIYSTSIPPATAGGIMAAVGVMRDEPQRQRRVRELGRSVRGRLVEMGVAIPVGDSPIIPVIVGSEQAAMGLARRLEEAGLLAPAIRPPTVRPGTSRVRITLSCEHSDEEIERLIGALKR
jgi:8-amino-7-oxononanoate synthase